MTDPDARRAVAALTREVASLRSELKKLSRRPRLPNSSLNAGSLNIRGGKITTWIKGDDGQTEYESTTLGGNGPQSLQIFSGPGEATAAIAPTGDVSCNNLASSTDISVQGIPLLGRLINPDGPMGAVDVLSWGSVAYADFTSVVEGVTVQPGGSVTPYGQFMAELKPNRMYQLSMPWRGYVASTTGADSVHQTINMYMNHADEPNVVPPNPTIGDAYIGSQGQRWPVSNVGVSDCLVTTVITGDPANGQPVNYKFMLGLWTDDGTFTPDTDPNRITMWRAALIDVGPRPWPAPVTKPGDEPIRTYTSTWLATDSASWAEDGDRNTYFKQRIMLQGPEDGHLWHSAFVCNGGAIEGETGKTVHDALDGATISKVEVWLEWTWFYGNNGGVAKIQQYPHGHTNPSSIEDTTGQPDTPLIWSIRTRSGSRWMTLPDVNWIDKDTTGLMIGPGPDSPSYHGHFYGAKPGTDNPDAHKPRIRITYTR